MLTLTDMHRSTTKQTTPGLGQDGMPNSSTVAMVMPLKVALLETGGLGPEQPKQGIQLNVAVVPLEEGLELGRLKLNLSRTLIMAINILRAMGKPHKLPEIRPRWRIA